MRTLSSFPTEVTRQRKWMYPFLGTMLATGAPAGHLALRCALGQVSFSVVGVRAEVGAHALSYAYMWFSTLVVFLLLGRLVGKKADGLAADSARDPLTGLWNRRHSQVRMNEELRRARRDQTALTLLLIDVDRLKSINDQQGHQAGDMALRVVAQAIQETRRHTDVATRIGGDEFMVLAPSTTEVEGASLADRIQKALQFRSSDVTVSIGISDLQGLAEQSGRALFAAADRALYEAKHLGRNRFVVAHEGCNPSASPYGERGVDDVGSGVLGAGFHQKSEVP